MTTERMPHVLVADDNKAHCTALGQVLERAGYEVAFAADGQEALLRLRNQPFDLVVADLRMPGLSGLGLLRKIRSKGPEVPVVILTAFGDLVTYADAMNSGAVAYLCKPVRRADLLRAARKAVGRQDTRTPTPCSASADRAQDAARA